MLGDPRRRECGRVGVVSDPSVSNAGGQAVVTCKGRLVNLADGSTCSAGRNAEACDISIGSKPPDLGVSGFAATIGYENGYVSVRNESKKQPVYVFHWTGEESVLPSQGAELRLPDAHFDVVFKGQLFDYWLGVENRGSNRPITSNGPTGGRTQNQVTLTDRQRRILAAICSKFGRVPPSGGD